MLTRAGQREEGCIQPVRSRRTDWHRRRPARVPDPHAARTVPLPQHTRPRRCGLEQRAALLCPPVSVWRRHVARGGSRRSSRRRSRGASHPSGGASTRPRERGGRACSRAGLRRVAAVGRPGCGMGDRAFRWRGACSGGGASGWRGRGPGGQVGGKVIAAGTAPGGGEAHVGTSLERRRVSPRPARRTVAFRYLSLLRVCRGAPRWWNCWELHRESWREGDVTISLIHRE
mmetsp:Transcript_27634/g.82294  ORF Transcript_27634/g.82294 Transcript_27634/m.82294 type:complete len:230 (+) Transcript_27634:303-992(+)